MQKLTGKPRRLLAPPVSLTFKEDKQVLWFQERVLEKFPALSGSFVLHGSFSSNSSHLSSELAFPLLKSKIFVIVKTFSVPIRIRNATILWSLQTRLSVTEVLQSFSWFVSSKPSSASFLLYTPDVCKKEQSSMHSGNLVDDTWTAVLFYQQMYIQGSPQHGAWVLLFFSACLYETV